MASMTGYFKKNSLISLNLFSIHLNHTGASNICRLGPPSKKYINELFVPVVGFQEVLWTTGESCGNLYRTKRWAVIHRSARGSLAWWSELSTVCFRCLWCLNTNVCCLFGRALRPFVPLAGIVSLWVKLNFPLSFQLPKQRHMGTQMAPGVTQGTGCTSGPSVQTLPGVGLSLFLSANVIVQQSDL